MTWKFQIKEKLNKQNAQIREAPGEFGESNTQTQKLWIKKKTFLLNFI